MRRFLVFLGLLLALASCGARPAQALTALQTVILSQGACANVAVKIDFAANDGGGIYCLNGARYPTFLSIPGATFTRASTKTCLTSAGGVVSAASGVPCITDLGILLEESRTNSFLNSGIGVTQSVTTTAASWTLSFYGTGSITLSGGATGTLNGTGANNRVSLTVTATAASTTLTVSGSTTSVQFEAGPVVTSYIATGGTAVTRAADVAALGNLNFPLTGTVLADYIMPTQPSANRAYLWGVNDSSSARFAARGSDVANPQPSFVIGDGVTNSSLVPYAATTGQSVKTAFAYDATTPQAGVAVNGTDAVTARQAVPATLTNATLGIGFLAGSQLNSYIKRLVVMPTFYSPAQRIAATQ